LKETRKGWFSQLVGMTHQTSFSPAEFAAKKKTTRREKFLTRMEVHADAGYTGVAKRAEIVALERKIDWQIAGKRGTIKSMAEGAEKETLKALEKAKASVRAFVEHPFHILKNLFRHRKVRYRGLAKNGHQLHTLFGLANVAIGGRTATA